MDFDFISQFYYGNITPCVQDMPKDSDLGKAAQAFSDAEEQLCAALYRRGKACPAAPAERSR